MRRVARRLDGWLLSIFILSGGVAYAQDEPPPEPEPEPEAEPAPEEPAEEEVAEEDPGISLKQPPPKGKGAIVGIVTESKLGEPAIDAFVGIVGTKIAVLTEIDGSFRLEVPPGKYQLQVAYELHKPVRIPDIVVAAGAIARIDVKVDPEENVVEEGIETVVEVDKTSVEGLLLERQRSAASGDSIGRAEITKSNDRNAAEAAKRVVGANIEGSRFLFVRGLGERYTNALLDGFPLPSPEPDRQAVPLDLFPSQILDSLTIVKTFTPDVPGDFAGGSVRINTRRIPNALTIAGSLTMGFNTSSTFTESLTYDGGSLDWLGIDDGSRALPEGLPSSKIVRGLEDENGELITKERIAEYGEKLNSPLSARRAITPPNHSGNFVIANSWPLGNWGRVGVMGALVYDRRFESRTNAFIGRVTNPADGATGSEIVDGFKRDQKLLYGRSTDKVSWGALAGVTLEIGEDHTISVTAMHTRASDNEASSVIGTHKDRGGAKVADTRLSFVSRSMTFGELHGKSVIAPLNRMEVEYGVGIARASRDEPNTRGAVYQYDGNFNTYTFEDDSSSGSHFYSEQGETTVSAKLDITQPLLSGEQRDDVKVKFGTLINLRDREFLARRFRFRPDREGAPDGFDACPGPNFELSCPDKLFTNENIRGGFLQLEENTANNDGYTAGLNVYAGYAMVDAKPIEQLRIVVGPRLEASESFILPFDPTDRDAETVRTESDEIAVLPSASLIWTPSPRMNFRTSLTRTVARPQLRELAPFAYTDYFGGNQIRGNPDLVNTSIVNADTRFEYFPTAREVLAVSAFYKRFENPIEQVLYSDTGSGVLSFENGLGGNLFGIELEARKSFDIFAKVLRPLSLIGNVTFAHSTVDVDTSGRKEALTSKSRPLSLQAPYIANIALDFDYEETGTRARILYNLVGPRLTFVGTKGIPDVYEGPRHGLDVTVGQKIGKHVEVRGSATNLIDAPVERRYGDTSNVFESYDTGRTFSIGVALSY
ncbi:MAG: TonB-dependent receptor [Polyangiaceae bacterium]|nr:TonB-dependent receptor [Polyangiaceae bacterium]